MSVYRNVILYYNQQDATFLCTLPMEAISTCKQTEHNTNKQFDLLNSNTENNKIMKSLTYKIIPNHRAGFVLQNK